MDTSKQFGYRRSFYQKTEASFAFKKSAISGEHINVGYHCMIENCKIDLCNQF